jgi:hypothetical protein
MSWNRSVLSLTVAALLCASTVGFACDHEKKEEAAAATATATAAKCATADCPCAGHCEGKACGDCASKMAQAATLAAGAEGGCPQATAAMYELAKGSGRAELVKLAVKAEEGCAPCKTELIAKMKALPAATAGATTAAMPAMAREEAAPSMAELAKRAEGGCPQSTAALIDLAKKSSDPKLADLAAKAETGNADSKAELISLAQKQ